MPSVSGALLNPIWQPPAFYEIIISHFEFFVNNLREHIWENLNMRGHPSILYNKRRYRAQLYCNLKFWSLNTVKQMKKGSSLNETAPLIIAINPSDPEAFPHSAFPKVSHLCFRYFWGYWRRKVRCSRETPYPLSLLCCLELLLFSSFCIRKKHMRKCSPYRRVL